MAKANSIATPTSNVSLSVAKQEGNPMPKPSLKELSSALSKRKKAEKSKAKPKKEKSKVKTKKVTKGKSKPSKKDVKGKTTKKASKSKGSNVESMVAESIGIAASTGKMKAVKLNTKDESSAAEHAVTSVLSKMVKTLSDANLKKSMSANVDKTVASAIAAQFKDGLGSNIRQVVLGKSAKKLTALAKKAAKVDLAEKASKGKIAEMVGAMTGDKPAKATKSKAKGKATKKVKGKVTKGKTKGKGKKSKK